MSLKLISLVDEFQKIAQQDGPIRREARRAKVVGQIFTGPAAHGGLGYYVAKGLGLTRKQRGVAGALGALYGAREKAKQFVG